MVEEEKPGCIFGCALELEVYFWTKENRITKIKIRVKVMKNLSCSVMTNSKMSLMLW